MSVSPILTDVANYYGKKIGEFGATHQGVDWATEESQKLRFVQLEKLLIPEQRFSILDYGCGFGSFYMFLSERNHGFDYIGFDISEKMIEAATRLHMQSNAAWTTHPEELHEVDYTVASGIFNVRLDHKNQEWEQYIADTLRRFHQYSLKGFAFNTLTSYSDKERQKDYLYYADPTFWFDYCVKNFSRNVSLLHDYPLYEFTILVKRNVG